MPDDAAGRRVNGVELVCLRLTVWRNAAPVVLEPTTVAEQVDLLREATAAGGTVWLQLALPDLSDDAHAFFEGSLDPWRQVPQPTVDWTGLYPVLAAIGLPQPSPANVGPSRERRLLFMLPHLYGRGIARAAGELSEVTGPRADARLVLTVGFEPRADSVPQFWALRTNVVVIRNVAISVRLPDLLCSGLDAGTSIYRAPAALDVADRFYPAGSEVTAHDVADAIALHQAATARVVSESVRTSLREIERRWAPDSDGPGSLGPKQALHDGRRVMDVLEVVYQLDRQVSRLLRRYGSYGDRDGADGVDLKLRYRFALDELRSLQADCRQASEAVERASTTREREDHERFQFVAAILGAAILFPTLVAGVYGANVALPAEESWNAFIALLLFIVAFAALGLVVIGEAWRRRWAPITGWFRRGAFRIGMAVFAAVAFAGGVLAVWSG